MLSARINALTSDIIDLDTIDEQNVVNLRIFSPSHASASMAAILQKLLELPVGQYIVQHAPGEGHIKILRATEMKKRYTFQVFTILLDYV